MTETLQRAKQKKITVIVITQRPNVLNCMDKLLILRAGRIEAFGPPSDVLMRVVKPRVQTQAKPADAQETAEAQLPGPAPEHKEA